LDNLKNRRKEKLKRIDKEKEIKRRKSPMNLS